MQHFCCNVWCRAGFEISEADQKFYERITVPPPTLCADCRLQRRLAWRNEWSFYKHRCALCKKNVISIYSPDKLFTIYCPECWWGDQWDPLSYGRPYDFSKSFFDQFAKLLLVTPRLPLIAKQCENCEYNANITFSRNCYLSTTVYDCEDAAYCWMITRCRNVLDAYSCNDCELCYEIMNCRRCYSCAFLRNSFDCIECAFCIDCQNCKHCVGCINLRGKEYYLFNQPSSKEEIGEYRAGLSSQKFIEEMKQKLAIFYRGLPHRASHQMNAEQCTGDFVSNSRNCRSCFDLEDCEDCARCYHANKLKDSRDVFGALMGGELQYECSAAGGGMNVQFAYLSWHNTDARYLNFCEQCEHCLGCISLKRKKYCILNKQYTKEEYDALLPKILEHMKSTPYQSPSGSGTGQAGNGAAMNPNEVSGSWGEFFPVTISPYAYNETLAQEFFPLTKEEVLKRGWQWRERMDEIPKVEKIFDAELLPDSIEEIPDDILNWAMHCSVTKRPYQMQRTELAFYRRMRLPIPRKHPDQRRKERMLLRNPRKLWNRVCQKCGEEIKTSYGPERPEIVYCEKCYLQSVY